MMPLALLTDTSIGDTVCALAALQIVAKQYERIAVVQTIPDLGTCMMPTNAATYFIKALPNRAKLEVMNMGVGAAMLPRYGHPIRQILDHLGVESPSAIPQPYWHEKETNVRWDVEEQRYIVEPITYPQYDFLLHMNTDDGDRLWPFSQWAKLIEALLEEYPGCSIGILGSDKRPPWNNHRPDPRPFATPISRGVVDCNFYTVAASINDGVAYVYNRSFSTVGSLIKRARKAVITIDSSISRIAHAVGSKNHVLLCPDAYPVEWSSHPGCFNVVGNPKTWAVDTVMQMVYATKPHRNGLPCALAYKEPKLVPVDLAKLKSEAR